jgi:septal ring factor EnvC (AmiA/AmiB activator)
MATTVPEPPHQPQAAPPEAKGRPWIWIVLCTLLAVVAVVLAIWAISLNGDLNDEKDKNAAAQQQAAATQQDVQAVSDQVNDLSKSVDDTTSAMQQAGENAQKSAQDAVGKMRDSIDSMKAKIQDALGKLEQQSKSGAQPNPTGTPAS